MRIIFSSDLHGNITQYEKLVEIGIESKADVMMIGGDLFPFQKKSYKFYDEYTQNVIKDYMKSVDGQIKLFKKEIFPRLQKFVLSDDTRVIYITLGNGDMYGIVQELTTFLKEQSDRIIIAANKIVHLSESTDLFCYCSVPLKFSNLADWCRFDFAKTVDEETKERLKTFIGWSSFPREELLRRGVVIREDLEQKWDLPCITIPQNISETYSIESELKLIEKDINPQKKLIILAHAPPGKTRNSLSKNIDYGAESMKNFLLRNENIPLYLCGHAHQVINENNDPKFRETGIGSVVNNTVVVSSANWGKANYLGVVIVDYVEEDGSSSRIVRREIKTTLN